MEDRQAANFTWYPNYTEACEGIEDPEERLCFMEGIVKFGTYGIEPEFDNKSLHLAFVCLRPNLENSRNGSINGRRGSDRKKEKAEANRRKDTEREYAVSSDAQSSSSGDMSPTPSHIPSISELDGYQMEFKKSFGQ